MSMCDVCGLCISHQEWILSFPTALGDCWEEAKTLRGGEMRKIREAGGDNLGKGNFGEVRLDRSVMSACHLNFSFAAT